MKDVIAIIPAAGLGTRFLPLTRVVSKELLPILNKPALHYILEELLAAGLTQVVIVTREGKDDLRRYCDVSKDTDDQWCALINHFSITWVYQSAPKGLGHAILSSSQVVGDAWSLVALPDMIMDCPLSCSRQLVDAHAATGKALVAAHAEMRHPLSSYGVLDIASSSGQQMKLNRLVEKPSPEDAPSHWAISGRYLLPPAIFSILQNTAPGRLGEIQLTDALNVLVKEGVLEGYAFKGRTLDTGNVAGWLEANIHFAQKDPAYADLIMGLNRSSPT